MNTPSAPRRIFADYQAAVNKARDRLTDAVGLDDKLFRYLNFILAKVSIEHQVFWYIQAGLAERWDCGIRTIKRVHKRALELGAIEVVYTSDRQARDAGVPVRTHHECRIYIRPVLEWFHNMPQFKRGKLGKRVKGVTRDTFKGDTADTLEGDTADTTRTSPPSGTLPVHEVNLTSEQGKVTDVIPQEWTGLDWFIERWNLIAEHTAIHPIEKTDLQQLRTNWTPEFADAAPAVLHGLINCPLWLGKSPDYPHVAIHPNTLFSKQIVKYRKGKTQEYYVWQLLVLKRHYVYTSKSLEERVRTTMQGYNAGTDLDQHLRESFYRPYELPFAKDLAVNLLKKWWAADPGESALLLEDEPAVPSDPPPKPPAQTGDNIEDLLDTLELDDQ